MNKETVQRYYGRPNSAGYSAPKPHTKEILLTPTMAARLLKQNTRNRRVSPRLVDAYASDMVAGRWKFNHQGIAIYIDGTIADGQHRLLAVIKSGCTIRILLTTNMPKDAGVGVDVHRPRSAVDVLNISGSASWVTKDIVAVVRGIHKLYSSESVTHQSMARKAGLVRQEVEFSVVHLPKKKRLSSGALRAAVAIAYHHVDTNRLEQFCAVMHTGVVKSEDDLAAIKLRESLLTEIPAGGYELNRLIAKKTMRAIKAFCDRERLSKLMTPSSYIYHLSNHDEFMADS